MEVGASGVVIGRNAARHVGWEYGHVSGSVTILSLSMVVDRVTNKNVKRRDTAENRFAIQV